MDETTRLTGAAIFEGISPGAMEKLNSRCKVLSFTAGQRLFERGDDAKEMMVLHSGVVELLFPVQVMGVSRELTVETKRTGEVVAWSALVSPFSFTLSARCATDGVLSSLNRGTLEEFFKDDPQAGYLFMRNLAGVIGKRLQTMQGIWLHDLQTSATERLE